MGLDMYLTAKMSLYDKDKRSAKVRKIFPVMFKSGNINYIRVGFEGGYWRKANHIHEWFVTNVQGGVDDCGYYAVGRETLKRLLDICRKIMTNPEIAEELLPTQAGFFFGSTEYDEYYCRDLKRTVEIIERCLQLPEEWSFEYHSSW